MKVKLWLVRETPKAILFTTLPPDDPAHRQVWVPRSQISHLSIDRAPDKKWTTCLVDISEWFAEKEDL